MTEKATHLVYVIFTTDEWSYFGDIQVKRVSTNAFGLQLISISIN